MMVVRIFLLALMLVIFSQSAQGQSRFGNFLVQENIRGWEDFLLFDGKIIGEIEYAEGLSLIGVKAFDESADVALVQIITGGNSCAWEYALVFVSQKDYSVSQRFGRCEGKPIEFEVRGNAVEVSLVSSDPAFTQIRAIIQNGMIREIGVRPSNYGSQVAADGEDVRRWIGQDLSELFKDAGERKRFLEIMTQDKIDQLRQSITMLSSVFELNGYIIGMSCRAHFCRSQRAGYTISIATGYPTAILYDSDKGTEFFGADVESLPDSVRDALYSLF